MLLYRKGASSEPSGQIGHNTCPNVGTIIRYVRASDARLWRFFGDIFDVDHQPYAQI